MIRDPIVEEIHEVRTRLWEECGGDFEQYVARLKQIAGETEGRRITLEERRRGLRHSQQHQPTES